jgi:alpha-N-arabinofuranosidase
VISVCISCKNALRIRLTADLYSIHLYTFERQYYKNVTAPNGAENAIQICSQLIDLAKIEKHASDRDVRICFDEWNVWDAERAVGSEGAEEKYTLQDALAVATWLNVFIRQARVVGMAKYDFPVSYYRFLFLTTALLRQSMSFHRFLQASLAFVCRRPTIHCNSSPSTCVETRSTCI